MKMSKVTTELLARFFEDRTTKDENDMIADWIESDPSNQEMFNRELRYHLMLIEASAVPAERRSVSKPLMPRHRIALAAGMAAALLAGAFLMWTLVTKPLAEESSQLLSLMTEAGQRATVTLPDGTTVELNSGTTLEYPAVFSGKERRVRVDGEAMFDVASDSRKPFFVETFAYDVKVLGTRFNVIAEEQTGEFSTALIEGKVSIVDKVGVERAILLPSQVASKENNVLRLCNQDDADAYLWTEGIISVAGVPFDALVRRMERCYGVKIVMEKEEMPQVRYRRMKLRISDGIEFALNAIQRESDFNWRYDDLTCTYYIY